MFGFRLTKSGIVVGLDCYFQANFTIVLVTVVHPFQTDSQKKERWITHGCITLSGCYGGAMDDSKVRKG